jgi:putative ABC transport system permease protein
MIDYRENLAMAMGTIMVHKFRSFLTVLGIVVGVLVVIVIASIITGARESIVSQIESLGTNNIIAFHLNTGVQFGRRPREEMLRKPLTLNDALAIKEQCRSVQDVAWRGMSFGLRVPIQYKGNTLRNANLMGVSANYGSVSNIKVDNGRFFTDLEDDHRMLVTVLGPDASEAMFPNADPIGKQILIKGHPYTVVGVTEKSKMGTMTGGQADNFVIIPYGAYHKMMPAENKHILFIQVYSGMRSKAFDEVESLLRRRRGVKMSEPNNFDLTTADRVIQQFDSTLFLVGVVAFSISGVGLLVGGIGVMNIMLVSVTERTREIGVRKAIGATKRDIVLQFLFEAMVLTGVGGAFGIILAIAASYLVVAIFPALPSSIPLWAVATGLTVSVAIGLIFGVWPAFKAAKLDPIEALRYE